MKIFVTGGTGFIGGHLVRKLLARGDDVTVLARTPTSAAARALEEAGAVVVQGDVTERESMRESMQGAELVHHVAGWIRVGVREKKEAYASNVEGTRNTIGLAKELGIPRIVYVSTASVFGNTRGRVIEPIMRQRDGHFWSVYDHTKYLAHGIVDEFIEQGAPVIICCPGLVYGPDDPGPLGTFINLILHRKMPMLPARNNGASWVHVEDVAAGLLAAADKGQTRGLYVLGGDNVTYGEVIGFMGQLTGIRMPILLGSKPLVLMKGVMSIISAVVPVPEQFHPETLAFLGLTEWVSHEKSVEELNYTPRPYQEGLRQTVLHEMEKLGLTN